MPKVSVIVPNYRHVRYLAQRIESVLNQTYRDFSVLIMDDASGDDSRTVIERYRDRPGVSIVYNDANSGSVFRQWEKGVRLTDSDYVWIAESDDWADPIFLEKLAPLLDTNPDVGIAYCQSWIADPAGQVTGNAICWTEDLSPTRWRAPYLGSGMEELRRYVIRKNTIPNASAVLQRRSALMECLPLRTDFKLCGDWHHWAMMLGRSGIAYVPESLNFWRFSTSNARTSAPGVLEWQEGEPILDLIGDLLALPSSARTEAKLAFLRHCWGWLKEHAAGRTP